MKSENVFLLYALHYARELKWRVFPIKPRAKQPPLTKHGFQDASQDEKQICAWWEQQPDANIGIAAGDEFWALDIDPRHGGEESRAALVAQHGAFAETLRQITGGGGSQWLYQMPDQTVIKNATEVCGWKGIDVRGAGGYIVAPPSIHPSGQEYRWDNPEQIVSPADAWLVEAIAKKSDPCRPRGPSKGPFQLPTKIPHGKQHDYLVSEAGKLRSMGLEYTEILAALWATNQSRCEKPGPREAIEQYARSVCNYPAGKSSATGTPAQSALINVNQIPATIELLNSLTIWQGRLQFTSIERKGPMLIARTTENAEILWTSTSDLGSFTKSQAVIADCTNILIPTPKKGEIRWQWEQAEHMLLQLAAENATQLELALKEETRDWLRLVFQAASHPHANSHSDFIDYMRAIQKTRRNPRWGFEDRGGKQEGRPTAAEEPIPPCVFVAEESVWVHVPSFRSWLSIPALINRMPVLTDVRNGLLLLGFVYHENLCRRDGKDVETLCLWCGPLGVLESM
jgi:hypothetical protein